MPKAKARRHVRHGHLAPAGAAFERLRIPSSGIGHYLGLTPARRGCQDGESGMNVRRRQTLFTVLYAVFSIALLWSIRNTLSTRTVRTVSYTEFGQLAQEGSFSEAEIRASEIVARVKPKAGDKPGPS